MPAVEMKVALVAVTEVTEPFWDVIDGTALHVRETSNPLFASDADLLVEAAGRKCYESFHLPNAKTYENENYLANIKRQMHYSVLEHASFTFYIEGVSRALLAEMTRHRHHSWSVRSQRYVDEGNSNYVVPRALMAHTDDPEVADLVRQYGDHMARSRWLYRAIQQRLEVVGESRKSRNDAARYVLPESTETKFFVTANGRAWLELLSKRKSEGAADEIRALATKIHQVLAKHSPGTFKE